MYNGDKWTEGGMRRLFLLLFFCFACFTPIAVVAAAIASYYRMSAIHNGTELPNIAMGHVYPMQAQRFHSPELIVYVTSAYYKTYAIAGGILFAWVVGFVCSLIVLRVLGAKGRSGRLPL
jgi:hypothetical protein